MNYLPAILQIQKEQLKNPLHRYKKVREFYREVINKNCIFQHLSAFPDSDYSPSYESFPKSLFPKFTPSQYNLFEISYHDKIVPVTIELAVEVCDKFRVEENNIRKGFEWDHFYAVCPEIVAPLSYIEQLDEVRNKQWIKITSRWILNALEELNEPKNL